MCILDEQVDEGVIDRGPEMTLERLLFFFCARLVESLEMDVVGSVGFHVGECGCQWKCMRFGLISEFLEGG